MQTVEKPTPNPIAAATRKGQDAAAIDQHSQFARAVHNLFARIRPQKIVETGTYTGLGSTLTICQALKENDLSLDQFYSIEVNPSVYAQARENLAARHFAPRLLNGLSVPRHLLPTEEQIRRETIDEVVDPSIFIDHQPDMRVFYYHRETHFPDAIDDLLGSVIRTFEGSPHFLLLDSGGHMGFVEFQYALTLLRGRCCIALDDVYHVKHHRSLRLIEADARFQVLELSREKFGFCIAQFDPAA